ncbi:MAG: methyltransferase [Bacteroidetes bacterium]|nr:methyltransferase [Bacteroidota bacterium]
MLDKRSISAHVFNQFRDLIYSQVEQYKKLNVLDVGAGLGSLFKRICDLGIKGHIEYTVIDIEEAHVATARSEIGRWLRERGHVIREESPQHILVKDAGCEVNCQFVTADALTFAAESPNSYDVLVGQAFLDIIPLRSGLKSLFKALRPGGVFYFPINFDGISALLPVEDKARDTLVEDIFHQSMDERDKGRTGGSQTGRQLLDVLPVVGARIDAVGASDWIVRPMAASKQYPHDEKYFLGCILKFMHNELLHSDRMPSEACTEWFERRYAQLELGQLKYIAHQLDYTGRFVGE